MFWINNVVFGEGLCYLNLSAGSLLALHIFLPKGKCYTTIPLVSYSIYVASYDYIVLRDSRSFFLLHPIDLLLH